MRFLLDKLRLLCEVLDKNRAETILLPEKIGYKPCGYETPGALPEGPFAPWDPDWQVRGRDAHFWFDFEIDTPAQQDFMRCELVVSTGHEGQWDACNPQLMVYLNGQYAGAMDVNHTALVLEPQRHYHVQVYYYVGMHEQQAGFRPSVARVDTRIESLYYDFFVALEGIKLLEPESKTWQDAILTLERGANLVDLRDIGSDAFFASLESARTWLAQQYYGKLCGQSPVTVSCIGHTHIDVAWLWTLEQTREKAQRSFKNMTLLMDRYPEFIFQSSQPQLYAYVKEAQPELFEKIKEYVKKGQWEVEGAMWLEADCNLVSGESFVRQIMHGKKFMREHFGVESRILWLPDVFGYSAALPQILKKSGVDYFVTSKISWNETNKMPVDTFLWQGLDGTEIFTHFLTAQNYSKDERRTTYNADITPAMVLGAWERFQQKAYNDQAMATFGFGDGGGGPTVKMLEFQRRMAHGLPGLPRTKIETTRAYLEHARENFEKACAFSGRTPRWVGELYLEFHRGTYTSIAKNKRNNRKSEFAMAAAEAMGTWAHLLAGQPYSAQAYEKLWQLILLHQFHDIIPGSSIEEVYRESDRDYAIVRNGAQELEAASLGALAANIGTEGGVLCVNPLGMAQKALVRLGGVLCDLGQVPAMGWAVLKPNQPQGSVWVKELRAGNRFFDLTLDEAGRIAALLDLRNGRQVFKENQAGNEWQAYEDYPRKYDAWEITDYYKQKKWVMDEKARITPAFDGCRAGFKVEKTYMHSTITQHIWLYDDLERIDFETTVDWHEDHQLIKAAFPFDLHVNRAAYEIQFGHIERETHFNHSWEQAKFEVCGHKWVDMSETGYGVSVLNDCKYGYSAEGSTLYLTLLKCAQYPNPNADQGLHTFTYSLYPHAGGFKEADTVAQAYALNQPVRAQLLDAQQGALPETMSFIRSDAPNFILETVKPADAGDGVIVRGYEAYDKRTVVQLTPGFAFEKAVLCDLLENELAPLEVRDGKIMLQAQNFEILTIKIR